MRRVVDRDGAAKRLGLSVKTLDKLRTVGGGPKFLKLPRRILYDEDDLDEWAAEHRHSSTSEYPHPRPPPKAETAEPT
ncbi:MAG TPA: DNA-binding protein [Deltaproteobacteria bacterium]|jgi:predicted DNA-binding transcriptional regulator AlpA|nr:DNA-binding protein [Deltaproteobacteria bacterium]